jgi:Fe2+ transport system protein FeoA
MVNTIPALCLGLSNEGGILTESQMDCVTNSASLWNNASLIISSRLMPAVALSTLAPGEFATIASVHSEGALHQRLLAMGFRTGKRIEVIRRARFSGPIQVRIGATDILLRRNEAEKIMVKKT